MNEFTVAEDYRALIDTDAIQAGTRAGLEKFAELGFLKILTELEPALVDSILRSENLSAALTGVAYVNYLNGLADEASRRASVAGDVRKKRAHQLLAIQIRDSARLAETAFISRFASTQSNFLSAISTTFGIASSFVSKIAAPSAGLMLAYMDLDRKVDEALAADDIEPEVAVATIASELLEFAVLTFAELSSTVTTAISSGTLVIGGVTFGTGSALSIIAVAASTSVLLTGAFLGGGFLGSLLNDIPAFEQGVGDGVDLLADFASSDSSVQAYPGEYGSIAFLANYLDGDLTADSFSDILKASAANVESREELIKFYNAITAFLAPDLPALLDGASEQKFLDAVVATLQIAKAQLSTPTISIEDISSLERDEITTRASNPEGIPYRYALRQLNPFVIKGNDGLYDLHNLDDAQGVGALDTENFSNEYINDRAAMLRLKITHNVADLVVSRGAGFKTYEDRITGENITVAPLLDGTPVVQAPIRIIFGSDASENMSAVPATIGSDDNHRIYGGLGNDFIEGKGGNDYLEGGAGNDELSGGAGLDTLVGGRGDDKLSGGAGVDTLLGGIGDDILNYNEADDQFAVVSDEEHLDAGADNDQYWGLSGGDSTFDVSGNDRYFVDFTSPSGENWIRISDQDRVGTIFYADGLSLSGGDLIQAAPFTSTYAKDGFTYSHSTVVGASRLVIRRDGEFGAVVLEDFEEGTLGITFETSVVPAVLQFQGSHANEDIFDFNSGTTVTRFGGDATEDSVTYTSTVQRIDGLGGDDNIQINADISELLVFGDSAFTGGGVDEDDHIEVDLLNVNAEMAPIVPGFGANIFGEGGDDFIAGSQRDDFLYGGNEHDFVSGRLGRDHLYGELGNDWLSGDGGNDVVSGGQGNDRLYGGAGSDSLSGGVGNDSIWGDAGESPYFRLGTDRFWNGTTETVTPPIVPVGFGEQPPVSKDVALGEGDGDILEGGAGDDFLYGGEGVDFLYGDDAGNTLQGNDVLQGEAGDDWLYGGKGNDTVWGDKDPVSYDADNAPLTPQGHIQREHADGRDVIGNDNLFGGRGFDILRGGDGNDSYHFGYGDGIDVITDKSGTDSIRLGEGIGETDIVFHDSSGDLVIELFSDGTATGDQLIVTDWFVGKPVESVIIGGRVVLTVADIAAGIGSSSEPFDAIAADEVNVVLADNNANVVTGSASDDTVYALGGHDVVAGGGGQDKLYGGDGDDFLQGNDGNDVLIGESGNDTLVGGAGFDLLDGGFGNDTYTLQSNWGHDGITDAAGSDTIAFGLGIDPATLTVTRSGYNLLLADVTGTNSATVVDWFDGAANQVEQITFSDGVIWDAAVLNQMSNTVTGGAGNDVLMADSNGDSVLIGGAGDDRLIGNFGNDDLQGGTGNDVLDGRTGNNILSGGAGADVYLIGVSGANDLIHDDGADGSVNTVRLAPGRVPGDISQTQVGNDLVLGWDNGSATISNYHLDTAVWDFELGSGASRTLDSITTQASGDAGFLQAAWDGFEQSNYVGLFGSAERANKFDNGIFPSWDLKARIVIPTSGPFVDDPIVFPNGNIFIPASVLARTPGKTWSWTDGSNPASTLFYNHAEVIRTEGTAGNDVIKLSASIQDVDGLQVTAELGASGAGGPTSRASAGSVRKLLPCVST